MSRRSSRRSRRSRRKSDAAVREVTEYIEDNPVTATVLALAAGAIATSVYRMTVGKPATDNPGGGPGTAAAEEEEEEAEAPAVKARATTRRARRSTQQK